MSSGPLAPDVIHELVAWLPRQGYQPSTARSIAAAAARLSAWMASQQFTLGDLSEELLRRFVVSQPGGTNVRCTLRDSIGGARKFFIARGYLHEAPVAVVVTGLDRELDQWCQWRRTEREVSEGLIRTGRIRVREVMVAVLDDDGSPAWDHLDVNGVNRAIAVLTSGRSLSTKSHWVGATRSLLRWALATGRVDHDISGGVLRPRIPYRPLPDGLSRQQADALIAATDDGTPNGLRDRAVLLLLIRLGVRASEVASLTLEDIDWAIGRLTVVGKNKRVLTLPIPVDVGDALVAWLRARPQGALDRTVFVRSLAPLTGMGRGGIKNIVMRRGQRAGLGHVHPHLLRHTAAMQVIAEGGSFAEARALLGHATAESNAVYARTDLDSLRVLVVPFGRVP